MKHLKKMETSGLISIKVEEAMPLLTDRVFYDIKNKVYVTFANGMATFMPEHFMPSETLIGIKAQISRALNEKKLHLVESSSQRDILSVVGSDKNNVRSADEANLERLKNAGVNVRSADEANLERLKNAGVTVRRRKDQCLTPQEVEAYTLYNRVKQRKKRSNTSHPQSFETLSSVAFGYNHPHTNTISSTIRPTIVNSQIDSSTVKVPMYKSKSQSQPQNFQLEILNSQYGPQPQSQSQKFQL